MTPKEKAKDLLEKYAIWSWNETVCDYGVAIQCASMAVDQIIKALENYDKTTEGYLKETFGVDYFSAELQNMDSDFRYWQEVKKELEAMK